VCARTHAGCLGSAPYRSLVRPVPLTTATAVSADRQPGPIGGRRTWQGCTPRCATRLRYSPISLLCHAVLSTSLPVQLHPFIVRRSSSHDSDDAAGHRRPKPMTPEPTRVWDVARQMESAKLTVKDRGHSGILPCRRLHNNSSLAQPRSFHSPSRRTKRRILWNSRIVRSTGVVCILVPETPTRRVGNGRPSQPISVATVPPNKELKLTKPSTIELRSLTPVLARETRRRSVSKRWAIACARRERHRNICSWLALGWSRQGQPVASPALERHDERCRRETITLGTYSPVPSTALSPPLTAA